jgi:hypothetical protein
MSTARSRRELLLGVGAAALIGSVSRKFQWFGTAQAQAMARPKRLVLFWTPNGTVTERFFPTERNGAFELNTVMRPLEPHKRELTILKNVRFSGTGDHKTGGPFSIGGKLFPATTTDNLGGPSIDQEIGAALQTTPLVVAGQSKAENYRGYISYARDGSKVAPLANPKLAYESVCGSTPIGDGGTANVDKAYQRLVLQAAIDDAQALLARLPPSERVKMEEQLEALTRLRATFEQNVQTVTCDQTIGTAFQVAGPDYATRVSLNNQLIALSFASNLRRVVSFMTAPHGHDNSNFGFLGVGGGDLHNTIAHGSAGTNATYTNHMATIGEWQCRQLADLVTRLKAIPEGTGTVFDNTVILWTSECTHGNHGHLNIPVVLVGSGGGFFRTNQVFDAAGLAYPRVLMSLAHAMGHRLTSFGESTAGPATALHA